MTIGLFDFLNSINIHKENLIKTALDEKDYTPFMINRGLSFFQDTILYVNYLNQRDIPKIMHYGFLLNAVPKKKRFSKWYKVETESDDLRLLAEHYDCSFETAKSYLGMLKPTQIEEIRSHRKIGGISK